MAQTDNASPGTRIRHDAAVVNVDMRVEAAKDIMRYIKDDDEVSLQDKTMHARGDMAILRGSRSREVTGDYESRVKGNRNTTVKGTVSEQVTGEVRQNSPDGSQTIMAGGYFNFTRGPYVRLCAWADCLAWGGWCEVDVARLEIAAVMIRSYWAYGHAGIARITQARVFVDEFQTRTEQFGVTNDSALSRVNVGVVQNEA